MVREEVDAAALALGAEAGFQVTQEVTDGRARGELLDQRQQPRQVRLTRQLLVAEAGGRDWRPSPAGARPP